MKTLKIVAMVAIFAFIFCFLGFWTAGSSLLISIKNGAVLGVGLVSVGYAIVLLLVGNQGFRIFCHDFKVMVKRR